MANTLLFPLWRHPHSITSLFPSQSSVSLNITAALPRSLYLCLADINGPFKGPLKKDSFNKPCPPTEWTSQWQTRPAASIQNKRRAFWKPDSHSEGVTCLWNIKIRRTTLIHQEGRNYAWPRCLVDRAHHRSAECAASSDQHSHLYKPRAAMNHRTLRTSPAAILRSIISLTVQYHSNWQTNRTRRARPGQHSVITLNRNTHYTVLYNFRLQNKYYYLFNICGSVHHA